MGNSERTKNALGRKSSIFIIGSIPGRISQTCCATRSRCISSTTILTTRLKSEASPPLFLVGHCASLTVSSKRISFHEKIAKQYLTRHALSCEVRLKFVINPKTAKALSSIFIFKCSPARPGGRVKALCSLLALSGHCESTRECLLPRFSPQLCSATSELLRIEHTIVAAGVDQLVLRQAAYASRWWQSAGCFHHVGAHEP